MSYIYDFGAHTASQRLGLTKTARNRMQGPDPMYYGDQDIDEDVRMNELEQLIAEQTARDLPPESAYKQESGQAGALGGGIAGALTGAGIGASKGGLKGGLIGAGIGSAGGGGLGLLGGRQVGSNDYKDDLSLQTELEGLEGSQTRQKGKLSRLKQEREDETNALKRLHDREMTDLGRRNINYNIQGNPNPYGF